jgi:hypothetical protein
MASYLVYDAQTSQPLFVQLSKSAPALSAEYAFIPVEDGTVIGRGDVVVNGALVRYVPTLGDAKAAKTALAEANMQARIAAGFTWSGKLYQIDADSQTRIAAMGALALGSIADPAGSPWNAGFYWVAADNSHVPMDAAATYAFARAVALYASGCILHLRTIKDTVADAADQAALDAVDVTAGYPTASG